MNPLTKISRAVSITEIFTVDHTVLYPFRHGLFDNLCCHTFSLLLKLLDFVFF